MSHTSESQPFGACRDVRGGSGYRFADWICYRRDGGCLGFRPATASFDVSGKAELPFHCARQEPAHAVLLPVSSRLAPSDWLSRVSTRTCLVTRSICGLSAFTGVLAAPRAAFDSTDRGVLLALAAADVALRRDVAFDLALTFLGAALLAFLDFAMERGDMGLGRWFAAPELTLARPSRSTGRRT